MIAGPIAGGIIGLGAVATIGLSNKMKQNIPTDSQGHGTLPTNSNCTFDHSLSPSGGKSPVDKFWGL